VQASAYVFGWCPIDSSQGQNTALSSNFMPLAVDTSGRVYDDFNRLLFLHDHREASALANELPEALGIGSTSFSSRYLLA
jgi:hypothetical protein